MHSNRIGYQLYGPEPKQIIPHSLDAERLKKTNDNIMTMFNIFKIMFLVKSRQQTDFSATE